MKKQLFFSTFLFLIIGTKSFAVLPPFYQSKKEIEAILNDERLHEMVGSGEIIDQIIKTKKGYTLITQKYSIEVDIEYSSQKMIGPVKFELKFYKPVEK